MRGTLSLGLIALLACAACTKPEPQPVASVAVPQPEQQPEPQAAPEPAQQAAIESPTVAAVPDDPTERLANCNLVEAWDGRIRVAEMRRDELRRQLEAVPRPPLRFIPLQDNPFRDWGSSPAYQELRMQLSEVEVELATLRAQRLVRAQLQDQIASYKRQLNALRRDAALRFATTPTSTPEVVASRETLDRLVQQALNECAEQAQKAATPIDDDPTAKIANCPKSREDLENKINELNAQLATLLLQYTDKHPRVVAVQETLNRLRQCPVQKPPPEPNLWLPLGSQSVSNPQPSPRR